MMGSGGYFSNAGVFLIDVVFGLYIFAVLLRFLLQLARADFYNPISQFVVKATNPLLRPLRRRRAGVGGGGGIAGFGGWGGTLGGAWGRLGRASHACAGPRWGWCVRPGGWAPRES